MTVLRGPRRMGGGDRETELLVGSWLRSRSPASAPPTLVPNVQARLARTQRRGGWRIADWWTWRPRQQQAPGFAFATVTAVLAIFVLGLGSVGVYLMFAPGVPGPLGAGAAADASATAVSAAAMESPATPADDPAPASTTTSAPPSTTAAPTNDSAPDGAVPRAASVGLFATLDERSTAAARRPAPVTGLSAYDLLGVEASAVVEVAAEPRLSGAWQWTGTERRYGDDRASAGSVAVGTLVVEGESGSWEGPFVGLTPPGGARAVVQAELTGAGGYEGSSAMLRYEATTGDPAATTVASVVYEGQPPQAPTARAFRTYDDYVGGTLAPADPGRPNPDEAAVFIDGSVVPDVLEVLPGGAAEAGLFGEETLTPVPWHDVYSWLEMDLSDSRLEVDTAEAITSGLRLETLAPGAVETGVVRARTDEGGGWSGSVRGFEPRDGRALEGGYRVIELTGEGAYTGVSALLFSSPDGEGEIIRWPVEGLLIPGEPPVHPAGR